MVILIVFDFKAIVIVVVLIFYKIENCEETNIRSVSMVEVMVILMAMIHFLPLTPKVAPWLKAIQAHLMIRMIIKMIIKLIIVL